MFGKAEYEAVLKHEIYHRRPAIIILNNGTMFDNFLTIEACEEFLYIQSNGANHYIPYGAIADIVF